MVSLRCCRVRLDRVVLGVSERETKSVDPGSRKKNQIISRAMWIERELPVEGSDTCSSCMHPCMRDTNSKAKGCGGAHPSIATSGRH